MVEEVEKVGGGSNLSQCVKHTQHAKHAFARWVWGHAAPGKFWKIYALRSHLRAFFVNLAMHDCFYLMLY